MKQLEDFKIKYVLLVVPKPVQIIPDTSRFCHILPVGIAFALPWAEGYAENLSENSVTLDQSPHSKNSTPSQLTSTVTRDIEVSAFTPNLSTLSDLTSQSMIPESGIMEWRHQRHVSRLRRPLPLSSTRSARFARRVFSPYFPLSSLVSG